MAKLTKKELSLHNEALDILEKDKLTDDERWFVLENWRPSAGDVTDGNAYFTPMSVAQSVAIETIDQGHLLDLCAGTGRLSLHVYLRARNVHWEDKIQITAVESNPDFVEVGRKVLPMVNWICDDIFRKDMWKGKRFTAVISNPPFGSRKRVDWLGYNGPMSLMALEIALRVSDAGATFVLPKGYAEYAHTRNGYKKQEPAHYMRKFLDMFGVEMSTSAFPTSDGSFSDTGIETEIISFASDEPMYIPFQETLW